MRVILLGTGGSPGVPMVGGADGRGDWGACDPAEPRNRRTRTSIVLEGDDGARLLVDTGPDIRTQLLANAIARVDAILYTHAHADHVTGLDDVRILNRSVGRPLEAFGLRATLDELAERFAYAFKPVTQAGYLRPALVAHAWSRQVRRLTIAGMRFDPEFEQDHGWVSTLGFRTSPADWRLRLFD